LIFSKKGDLHNSLRVEAPAAFVAGALRARMYIGLAAAGRPALVVAGAGSARQGSGGAAGSREATTRME
jgi:hypothetical protein